MGYFSFVLFCFSAFLTSAQLLWLFYLAVYLQRRRRYGLLILAGFARPNGSNLKSPTWTFILCDTTQLIRNRCITWSPQAEGVVMTLNYFLGQWCITDRISIALFYFIFSPQTPPPVYLSHLLRQNKDTNIASQCKSYRDTIFESDPLQGVAVCNPMLNEFLPQRGCDAGGAAVRADLSPGQTLGQFALGLGTGSGPREDGLAESSSSIPHRQDGRKLRHLLLNR